MGKLAGSARRTSFPAALGIALVGAALFVSTAIIGRAPVRHSGVRSFSLAAVLRPSATRQVLELSGRRGAVHLLGSSSPASGVKRLGDELLVTGSAADDTLVVDFSHGNPIPSGGLVYDGGGHLTPTGNVLVIRGGRFHRDVYDYTSASAGSIHLDGTSIAYRNLQPIANTGTAGDVVFNLPAGRNDASVQDDGTVGNSTSELFSGNGTFETTTFANPTSSLTVHGGGGSDAFTLEPADSLGAADVTVDSVGTANLDELRTAGTLQATAGTIAQASGGTLTTGSAALTSTGGISLTDATNSFGTLAFSNSRSGNVAIADEGPSLTLGTVGSLSGESNSAPGGTIRLSSASPFTYAVNMTSAGSITTTTSETSTETTTPLAPPDDDITVNSGVTVESTGGTVNFTSADNINLQSGSVVKSDTSSTSFIAGSGDNDNDAAIMLNGSVQASTTATLSSPGTITGSGSPSIKASSTQLTASTGIASSGSPLQTQVGTIGADTTTGGAFVSNAGTLSVAGANGVRDTGGSGNVVLTNSGSINITTANAIVTGPGNVAVTANGATADVATAGNNGEPSGAIQAGGTATVTAGRDILVGSTTLGFGDVEGGASLALSAGRDVTDEGSFLRSHGTGTVTVAAGRNITVDNFGAISSQSSAVNLSTGAGGTLTSASTALIASATPPASSPGGPITIAADDMSIGNGGLGSGIFAGNSTVTLEQAGTTARNIDLGGGTTAGDLGLSNNELGAITAGGGLTIGRTDNPGTITVTAPVLTQSGFSALSLLSGGAITQPGGSITVSTLAAKGTTVALTNSSNTVSTLSGSASAGAFSLTDASALTIGSASGVNGIHATAGATTLTAAGNVTVPPGVPVGATGALAITCGSGGTACALSDPAGGLTGSSVSLNAGGGASTINVTNENLTGAGPLAIDGGGGTSTATVTGAIVTHSPGAGLVLNHLGTANVTGGFFTNEAQDGISVANTTGGTIGGTGAGQPNTIAGSGTNGITMTSGSGVSFLENSIFASRQLGISLQNGANHGQRAPVITSATPSGGSTHVTGTLNSTPGHTFRVEFFDNPACDASDFGEGQTFLGSTSASTDGGGNASFDVTLPSPSGPGDAISATATDQTTGDTSQFSECRLHDDLGLTASGAPDPVAPAGSLTYTLTVSNLGPDASSGSTVTDHLPAGEAFQSASPGCSNSSGTVTCALGALANGAAGAVTITVKAPTTPGPVSNTATVAGNEQDVNSANDSATATVTVGNAAPPVITIKTPAKNATFSIGQAVRSSFSCAEGAGGPGLASCLDQAQRASGAAIDTTAPGKHTFTVTAVSDDGLSATQTISYTVLPSNAFRVAHLKTLPGGVITFSLTLPGPGRIALVETVLKRRGQSVFARSQLAVLRAGTLSVSVKPNAQGKHLLHSRKPVVIRLLVTYTPTGGIARSAVFSGLHPHLR